MLRKAILVGLLIVPLASQACLPAPTQHPGTQSGAVAALMFRERRRVEDDRAAELEDAEAE